MYLSQDRAPIAEALTKMKAMRLVPFDVPGHKRGRGNPELKEFLGEKCLEMDVNSMKPLDNLCHPISVIKDAHKLAAEAFGAANAFFMVGGTTSAVQAMIMSVVSRGDEIILPRNVHRSAINALVLSGAKPVYVNPQFDASFGISLGMRLADVKAAITEHPRAKAILVNNPTYYGICSPLKAITELAHKHNIKVLADEAHGTHFSFGDNLPPAAMAAGADMAAVSMHKSGGSLTQSSVLLCGKDINVGHVHKIINLTQSTSASYLLLASLDLARRTLFRNGRAIFGAVTELVNYARDEINALGDYYAYGREIINGDSVFDFDVTKLVVFTLPIGLAGVEVYDILRDEYDIQTEFGDLANLLAYVSVGDRPKDIERLVAALGEIRRNYRKKKGALPDTHYITPQVALSPQEAFWGKAETVKLTEAKNRIAAEQIMCYPPGIPLVAPGEVITDEILEYIRLARKKGCQMTGPQDMSLETVLVTVRS